MKYIWSKDVAGKLAGMLSLATHKNKPNISEQDMQIIMENVGNLCEAVSSDMEDIHTALEKAEERLDKLENPDTKQAGYIS